MVEITLNEVQKQFAGRDIHELSDEDEEQLVMNCPVTMWNTSCIGEGTCMEPKNPQCIRRLIQNALPGVTVVQYQKSY